MMCIGVLFFMFLSVGFIELLGSAGFPVLPVVLFLFKAQSISGP